jgi:type I restriction enzyme S subunit
LNWRITSTNVLKLKIPLPPLADQSAITDTLLAYDDLIENNDRRIALLEESVHLLYREWFVSLRFPGCDGGGGATSNGIPDGWQEIQLKDLATLNYGEALKKADRVPGPYPVFGSSGIVGYHNKYLVEAPGIVIGRKGNVGSIYWECVNI